MLIKVGPVIAQRDCVVKRQFELKKYGQIEFTIDGGTGNRKTGCSFFEQGKPTGFSKVSGNGINEPCFHGNEYF